MTVEEKIEICSNAFIAWITTEGKEQSIFTDDKDIRNLFTSQIILNKFKAFGVDIVLPDMLLLILNVCVENNPGQFQILLKDLLNSIKERKGPIPAGYVIKSTDFSLCFMTNFPIMDIPHINNKYEKLWDGQKIKRNNPFESDNLCDTPEWWKEVME